MLGVVNELRRNLQVTAAAIAVLQLFNLKLHFGGLANVCASLSLIYLVGLVLIWFVPETRGKPLPE